MKKRKALGVAAAVAVVVAFGVFAKEQVADKVAPFGLAEEKVYLEQVGEVLWSCGASFDGQRRDILLKIAPGRGVFYSANADDPHFFFSGEFNISGRNFHFDYSMLNHAGRGSELVGDGSPGAFTWDGILKKLDNGEMNFEATEKVIYEGRPVISKIVAKCKSLSAPAKSLASPQVAPQPPIVTKPTASEASPVVTETAPAADAAGAKPVASSASGSDSAKVETAHSGQMVYSAHCQSCHATGVLGAPMFGDKEGWAGRLKQPIEAIYSNAINGKGAMLPRGGSGASDTDIKAAVDYMVAAAK